MSLSELAVSNRVVGIKAVLRALRQKRALKVFLARDADQSMLKEITAEAGGALVEIEWIDEGLSIGRACAIERKAAAAALCSD